MKKNTLLLTLGLVILLGIGGYFLFMYRDSIIKNGNQQPAQPAPTAVTVTDKTITDATKPFSIDITYPQVSGQDALNKKITDIINNEITDFKKNSLDNDAAVKATDPATYAKYPREYDLKISYQKGEVDNTVASFIINVYNFEGGAHGANYFIAVNYDIKNQKDIALEDLFAGNPNYIKTISDYCAKDLTVQLQKAAGSLQGTWISDGAGPKAENFQVFLVNKDSITFYFAQYQVAPYVFGDFEVQMPRS